MSYYQKSNTTVYKQFAKVAKENPQKVMFFFEDVMWTFAQADRFINQIANYFQKQGYKKGDTIGLLLENRPEYPCLWLGLSKLGISTALINTNLVSDGLLHSFQITKCKAIIFGSSNAKSLESIQDNLNGLKTYQFHENPKENTEVLSGSTDLREELKNESDASIAINNEYGCSDPLLYIFTSGTTGFPKAAALSNKRYLLGSTATNNITDFKFNDIIYTSLPLYHSAGGVIAIGHALIYGSSVVIRKKFSASNYFIDCAKYKCTVAQYIGEMCRYILADPTIKNTNHCVRAIIGNGLRPQIWKEFIEKFNIQKVFEFYAATEGIANMGNTDNTVGSVGFIPLFLKELSPVTLIKCSEETGEPLRNAEGFCIKCKNEEEGLLVAKIDEKKAFTNFEGYSNESESKKKILLNVFRSGDRYFNSGDVLLRNEYGNFFFKDRTGDTFRWKGENVSTNEVESIISKVIQLSDAVVYGVQIPNTEGRAGMAAVVDENNTIDLDLLLKGLKSNLPSYAIPLFLRVMKTVPLTTTYKLKKIELRTEGFNINQITDDVYFLDTKVGKFVKLTREFYSELMEGKIRL